MPRVLVSKDRWRTSFKVGDPVTVVYLPEHFERTARLYAFLDLAPGLGLVPDTSARSQHVGLSVLLVLGTIFAAAYPMIRYAPIETDWAGLTPFLAAGALVGGVLLLLVSRGDQARQQQALEARNAEARVRGEAIELPGASFEAGPLTQGQGSRVWSFLAGAVLGCLLAVGGAFSANAWLDDAPPRLVKVEIDEMVMVTYNFVFRQYELRYRLPRVSSVLSLWTTPEHLTRFAGDEGQASVHAGALGWPWISTVEPLPPGAAAQP